MNFVDKSYNYNSFSNCYKFKFINFQNLENTKTIQIILNMIIYL